MVTASITGSSPAGVSAAACVAELAASAEAAGASAGACAACSPPQAAKANMEAIIAAKA